MAMPPSSIFLPYDIRGVVGAGLDADAAYLIGRAIGSEARQHGVASLASGRDVRDSSPALQQGLNRGLQVSGVSVLDLGEVSTPLLWFGACERCGGSGVMVTGSHNPPEYNGIKVMLDGETLQGDAITALHRRIVAEDFSAGEAACETIDLLPDYLQRLLQAVKLERPLRVVLDCGNGMAALTAPQLLQRLGCEVVPLYCEVDGRFPNHHPDPNRPENLRELQQVVLREQADLGIAFDGDGDRLGVVSPQGEIIWPDRVMMLLARDLLQRHPGTEVIYDIKCSRHLGTVIREAGGVPRMSRTGHSMLRASMRERGALLAGEMSGHLFLAEDWLGVDDALYAAARLLQIVASQTDTDLFAGLPQTCSTPELHLRLSGSQHYQLMETLLARREWFVGAQELITIDGLRVEYADGWGLVRASNTTPTLVLRFEADDEPALQRIQQHFSQVLHQLEPNLTLPF